MITRYEKKNKDRWDNHSEIYAIKFDGTNQKLILEEFGIAIIDFPSPFNGATLYAAMFKKSYEDKHQIEAITIGQYIHTLKSNVRSFCIYDEYTMNDWYDKKESYNSLWYDPAKNPIKVEEMSIYANGKLSFTYNQTAV